MPIYLYETIPSDPREEPKQYEIQQSIKDDALTVHPETGEPIERIITGGIHTPPAKRVPPVVIPAATVAAVLVAANSTKTRGKSSRPAPRTLNIYSDR